MTCVEISEKTTTPTHTQKRKNTPVGVKDWKSPGRLQKDSKSDVRIDHTLTTPTRISSFSSFRTRVCVCVLVTGRRRRHTHTHTHTHTLTTTRRHSVSSSQLAVSLFPSLLCSLSFSFSLSSSLSPTLHDLCVFPPCPSTLCVLVVYLLFRCVLKVSSRYEEGAALLFREMHHVDEFFSSY